MERQRYIIREIKEEKRTVIRQSLSAAFAGFCLGFIGSMIAGAILYIDPLPMLKYAAVTAAGLALIMGGGSALRLIGICSFEKKIRK